MTDEYNKCDIRFTYEFQDVRCHVAHLVTTLEFFVYTPLCLCVYVAYHRGYSSRYTLEVILATL